MVLTATTILMVLHSCEKKEISCPVPKATTAAKSVEATATALRNGDGPYVLNMEIQLSGENEVPAVGAGTKGIAHLRVTSDKKLYSKVIIQKVNEGDALLFSHVHAGATGVNGPVRIFLCHTADDFGKNIVTDLTDEQYNLLLNDPTYVNAHSTDFPAGIARGQIR